MVKGCEKRLVRLKNPESRYVEDVFFILKDGVTDEGADLLSECERLLRDNTEEGLRRARLLPLLSFLSGLAIGLALFLVC